MKSVQALNKHTHNIHNRQNTYIHHEIFANDYKRARGLIHKSTWTDSKEHAESVQKPCKRIERARVTTTESAKGNCMGESLCLYFKTILLFLAGRDLASNSNYNPSLGPPERTDPIPELAIAMSHHIFCLKFISHAKLRSIECLVDLLDFRAFSNGSVLKFSGKSLVKSYIGLCSVSIRTPYIGLQVDNVRFCIGNSNQ